MARFVYSVSDRFAGDDGEGEFGPRLPDRAEDGFGDRDGRVGHDAIDLAELRMEEIAVLSESPKGWRKELNLISWNDGEPKYDVRDWAPEHEKMGKGITLTKEEAKQLYIALSQI